MPVVLSRIAVSVLNAFPTIEERFINQKECFVICNIVEIEN